MKKTILFVNNTTNNPTSGGIQRVTDLLAKSLVRRGYKVIYLCLSREVNWDSYVYPVEMHFFPNTSVNSIDNVLFYNRFLEDCKIDVVVNQCGSFKASRLFLSIGSDNRCNVKVVTNIHNNPVRDYDCLYEIESKLRNRTMKEHWYRLKRLYHIKKTRRRNWADRVDLTNFIYDNSDIVCILSEMFIPNFRRLIPDALECKLRAISNPNTYSVQAVDFRKKKRQVLSVSRLWGDVKRVDRLIDVWEKLYEEFVDWELIIVGDGDLRSQLEEQAKGMPNVRFVGYQDPKPYYENASILCLTSNFEGFGMVLTEAQIHGVVPMSFNSFASVTDIIEDGENGLLVKPYSLSEYAKKLSWLMSNDERRVEMAKYAIETVKKFDVEIITDEWVKLFEEL